MIDPAFLLNGANLIARSCGGYLDAEGNELQAAMYAVLSDLQSCIDRNVHVTRGKEYISDKAAQ